MTSDPKQKLKVFLCHGTEDKPVVKELYRQLQQAGFQPWLDEADILPGEEWERAIRKAVRECEIILVCLSARTVGKSGFVQKEIRYALDQADEKPDGQIYLIPVKLEECEIPERLRRWQWVALASEGGFEKLLLALTRDGTADVTQSRLGTIQVSPSPSQKMPAARGESLTVSPRNNRIKIFLAASAVMVAVWVGYLWFAPKSPPPRLGVVATETDATTFSVTIRVSDSDGAPVKFGSITIFLEQDARTSPIAANGEANFKEIPLKFRNLTTRVLAEVTGYKLLGPETISLANPVIEIKLVRDRAALLEEIKSLKSEYAVKLSPAKERLSSSAGNYLNTCQRLLDIVRLHNADFEAYRRMSAATQPLGSIIPNTFHPPNPPDYATMRADLNKGAADLSQSYNFFQAETRRLSAELKQKMDGFQSYGIHEKADLPTTLDEKTSQAIKLLPSTNKFFLSKIVGGVG